MNVYWLIQAVAYLSLVVFLVPVSYIKKLFMFSFIGGVIYTVLVQFVAVNLLELWVHDPPALPVAGIPLFFVVSWFAVTKLYGYLLFRYPSFQVWIFIVFVLFTTINNKISYNQEQIHFNNWSIPETFMFAVFSHVLLLYFLKYLYKVDTLGAKADLIPLSLSLLKRK